MIRVGAAGVAVSLLVACAGGPIAIKTAPGAQHVTVSGVAIVVSRSGDTWGATHRDHLANNLFVSPADRLQRKMLFTLAIEQVSKCRVVDSTMDEGAAALNAVVRC